MEQEVANLDIRRVGRENAQLAEGIVVAIDVIRAFSVAAYAFEGGAETLWLVRTIEEAFELRQSADDILEGATEPPLLIGEVKGRLVPGFDLNNSPTMMQAADVKGRYLIQRTGAGTQGAVGAIHAQSLLVCSLVNAAATAGYIKEEMARTAQNVLTLLPTGTKEGYDEQPNEDVACADYLQALLEGRVEAREELDQNLERLRKTGRFEIFKDEDGDFPAKDIGAVLDIDHFDFVMVGKRRHWRDVEFVEVREILNQ
jgi:2-phosphosulfolactate phosphatase